MESKEGRYQEFTPATVIQVSHEVAEGSADPIDARRLLEIFCESPTPELIAHLQTRIKAYLQGASTSLESALGLTRKTRGHPKHDEHKAVLLALRVLEMRLSGRSYQIAVDIIAGENDIGVTQVKEAWREHKETARNAFMTRLVVAGKTLSESGQATLDAIYG